MACCGKSWKHDLLDIDHVPCVSHDIFIGILKLDGTGSKMDDYRYGDPTVHLDHILVLIRRFMVAFKKSSLGLIL